MNVGVVELIAYTVPPEWRPEPIARTLRRLLYSVMPQAVAAWARRLGHRVHYATYYGQADPASLLPADLDVVFVSATTQASGLAYALGKVFRRAGALTVLGGPHARCFPADALGFFDVVIGDCDEELVRDVLAGHVGPGSFVSGRRPTVLPGVEERFPDIRAAGFRPGRRVGFNGVAVLSSLGCPYRCDFCTEWNTPYAPLGRDDLAADLRFVARYPDAVVAFHDPNFAVRFDQTMDVIEAIPKPNRYVMECSLSVLRSDRLARLKRTNCLYVAPGVESWFDYGGKASAGGRSGREKLDHVVGRFRELHRYVPGLQANFLFGTDQDRGPEPADLTVEFARRVPFVWPNVNVPTPYGGTPLFDRYLREGRILRSMPLACYCAPYLVTTLKHYDPPGFYRQMIRIQEAATGWGMLARRLAVPGAVRAAHLVQTLAHRTEVAETRRVLHQLDTDPRVRAFHDGKPGPLPEFYHHRLDRRLGRYAELLTRADRVPVLEPFSEAQPSAAPPRSAAPRGETARQSPRGPGQSGRGTGGGRA